jgi:hypothetical protein
VAVKTSLTSFIDFTSVVGLRRARVPAQLRAMYDDPTRHPWDYYGPMIEAIKNGLGSRDMQTAVMAALADAQARALEHRSRGQLKHYGELAEGALALSRKLGRVTLFDPPTASWLHGDLVIRISPQVGLQRQGRQEAWLLYLKEPVLTQATADPALIIMSEAFQDQPEIVPRVVDVRRATVFGLGAHRNRAKLASWVRGEAELFVRLWGLPAA